MKRWICGVCGYIHEGDEPPEVCPACGAPKSAFSLMEEKTSPPPEPGAETPADATAEPAPPDADAESTAILPEAPASPQKAGKTLGRRLADLSSRLHAHPIAVHFPNGVLPAAVLFLLLALGLESTFLEKAAYYNLLLVTVLMPGVLASGLVDWKGRFQGRWTSVFVMKTACALIVLVGGAILSIWHGVSPEATSLGGAAFRTYLLGNLILLGAAMLAGFLGGRLVFRR